MKLSTDKFPLLILQSGTRLIFMSQAQRISKTEFIVLMATLTSLVALAIDSMLPAFPEIGKSLGVSSADSLQLIVAALFLGFGFGQLIFGPISDVMGRKPPIYLGIGTFALGSILSGFAPNYDLFLLGRFLQGLGGAAPRIISLALVRDEYSGNAMAQITSLVMTIFVLVPAIAPTLGQVILLFSVWRTIFSVLFLVSIATGLWFFFRQNETLPKGMRKNFSLKDIKYGIKETFSKRVTIICMITSGLVFGIFIAYLGAVQDIFSNMFHVEKYFPSLFAVLALSIGAASFFNSRLVMTLGMRKLIHIAFVSIATVSMIFAVYLIYFSLDVPPLWMFMVYMMLTFFAVGFLFGNLNALAMEPLGHVAGMGSALLGFVQSTLSVIIGINLGKYFHESIIPLVLSFALMSVVCLLIFGVESIVKRRVLEA